MFAAKNELFTRPSGGFVIPRSLRFRASASAYLTRTVSSTGDRQKATWSGWVKKGQLTITAGLFASDDGAGNRDFIRINGNDKLNVSLNENTVANLITTQVFRDPSAWYHFVIAIDTTQATAANRIKLYVNGTQITAFDTATYPSQNANFVAWNVSGKVQDVGDSSPPGAGQFFDGYMAEVYWIDGQQLTPTSFGATSTITGVWSPINYGGTYGTNGYHLTFNSYATAAALGTDTSGNSNTFTVNNCSVTAGVTYDSMIDVPTVTDTGSNYCVLNPLDLTNGATNATATFSQGNLAVSSGSGNQLILGSIGMDSGLWYWECTTTTGTIGGSLSGVALTQATRNNYGGFDQYSFVLYYSPGTKLTNDANSGNGVTYLGSGAIIGDVVCCAFNRTTGKIWWRVNNNAWGGAAGGDPVAGTGEAFSGLNTGTFYPCIDADSRATNFINFGQRPFAYTPPTGFNSLNTYNLAAASILKGNLYMDATTYTGTGASLSVTNAGGFQPGWVWAKSRSAATDHALYDSVRGTTKQLESNTSTVETTESTGLTAFNSTGFTVGALAQMNTSAATYVGWQWKAGSTVTNTSGSITSSVSASAASGFSVVTYTGNGSAGATIGHGLGITPSFIIVKCRGAAGEEWPVYHIVNGATAYMYLSATSPAAAPNATFWNNTAPTSSVFSVGTNTAVNYNAVTMLAYCFAPIAGYSAFGGYTGNGSADGPFIYCGFRPRWVLLKKTSAVGHWFIYDTARDTYNLAFKYLQASDAGAENTTGTANVWDIDILSNGFKIRNDGGFDNASSATYIYAAFAENPFNNSLAR